jgi:peptidoglycan-associated lipoprotein
MTTRTLSALSLSLAALAACSSNKPAVQADAQQQQKVEQAPPAETAKVTAVSDSKVEGTSELAAALRDLSNVSVFFETDNDVLSADAKDKLAAVAKVLAGHDKLRVRIEGNCDERGTSAYNLALGQRRAEAARRYLGENGAKDGQIQTVSLGNERPKAAGHDEASWQQNRRDDVVALDLHE